jgi:hypothetical protein
VPPACITLFDSYGQSSFEQVVLPFRYTIVTCVYIHFVAWHEVTPLAVVSVVPIGQTHMLKPSKSVEETYVGAQPG